MGFMPSALKSRIYALQALHIYFEIGMSEVKADWKFIGLFY